MSKNTLNIGEIRIGTLFDGNEATPELTANLELDETGILLSCPWGPGESSVFMHWFLNNVNFNHEVPTELKNIPSVLHFHDSNGPVQLIGCRSAGFHTDLLSGRGIGKIRAEFAVFNGSPLSSFDFVNGMRSNLKGLRKWIGRTSIRLVQPPHDESYEFSIKQFEVVTIPGNPEVTFRGIPRFQKDENGVQLFDDSVIQTRSEKLASLHEHLVVHEAIGDLLSISSWHFEDIEVKALMRIDSPHASLGQVANGEKWNEAIRPLIKDSTNQKQDNRNHFIEFDSIGELGVETWLKIHRDYSRAIRPILGSLGMKDAAIEVQFAQLCFGLEALGFLLKAESDGETAAKSRKFTFEKRLHLIAEQISAALPFDCDVEFRAIANSYNGIKHANREFPELISSANSWRVGVLLFRMWAATKVGMPSSRLEKLVSIDGFSNEFRLAT